MTKALPVPSAVVCPSWCAATAEEHLDDLREFDGHVIHHSEDRRLDGSHRSYVVMSLGSVTLPDGTVDEAPFVEVENVNLSPALARRVACMLLELADVAEATH